jgi:hypothetical protein
MVETAGKLPSIPQDSIAWAREHGIDVKIERVISRAWLAYCGWLGRSFADCWFVIYLELSTWRNGVVLRDFSDASDERLDDGFRDEDSKELPLRIRRAVRKVPARISGSLSLVFQR